MTFMRPLGNQSVGRGLLVGNTAFFFAYLPKPKDQNGFCISASACPPTQRQMFTCLRHVSARVGGQSVHP